MSKLTYTRVGDYFIPNLTVPEQSGKLIGKYGRMRQEYLKKHQPLYYNDLVMEGKLYEHLSAVDEAANERVNTLMPQYARAAGATEELKATDQMQWVGLINNARVQVEEIFLSELIYE